MHKTKSVALASQSHRTYDRGVNANGSEWLLCDCHGYWMERTVTDGKRSEWVRIVTLCEMDECVTPAFVGMRCLAHL